MLTVRCTGLLALWMKLCPATSDLILSATIKEPPGVDSGRMTANSSPPYRAMISVVRAHFRRSSPIFRSAKSPAGCPKRSLNCLKSSTSIIRSDRECRYLRGRSSSLRNDVALKTLCDRVAVGFGVPASCEELLRNALQPALHVLGVVVGA